MLIYRAYFLADNPILVNKDFVCTLNNCNLLAVEVSMVWQLLFKRVSKYSFGFVLPIRVHANDCHVGRRDGTVLWTVSIDNKLSF